ncbi:Clathrin light chain 2 [Vitis vinifera]|uniref:Clathrin light chain 2 n=1 Tax=Vitis vinifera TaxID=29760 RepID=A0A438HA50_VITVI|nr:Clathrin light chain 2 [Vitis vinifera]
MASFTDSFGQPGDESRPAAAASTRPFDDDGYLGYDPRLPSQRFDSFHQLRRFESVKESVEDSPIYNSASYALPTMCSLLSQSQILPLLPRSMSPAVDSLRISMNSRPFRPKQTGRCSMKVLLDRMVRFSRLLRRCNRRRVLLSESGEGRQNAITLEEKEKREKELLSQIIDEADEYKVEFYRRRTITCETNKTHKQGKGEGIKLFIANQEKFHAEADKNYWKAIAELIPNEVPAIEKKRGKKDQDKKPSIVVIQGPKPGKPTDLSRMRQILLKLKHNTPPHLKPSPPPAPAPAKDAKTGNSASAAAPAKAAVGPSPPEAVAAA